MYKIDASDKDKIIVRVDGGLCARFLENVDIGIFCAQNYEDTRLFIGDPLVKIGEHQYEATKCKGVVGVYKIS